MPPRMLAVAPVKKMLPRPRGSIRRAASRPARKPDVAGHLPDLAEDALGRLEDREIDVGADVEDADLERRARVGLLQEGGDVLFLARIERAAEDPAAGRLDLGDQRRQLVAVAAAGEDGEPFGGEFPGDGGADEVAGADHGHRGVSCCHLLLLGRAGWLVAQPRRPVGASGSCPSTRPAEHRARRSRSAACRPSDGGWRAPSAPRWWWRLPGSSCT